LELERFAALFCFQDKVIFLIEVYEAARSSAVKVVNFDGFIVDVGIEVFDTLGWLGSVDAEDVAELREERLIVGTLLGI
jgi:hypothetical protein